MGYTIKFKYSVSYRRHSTSPLTAELTCTEVFRKQIRFFTDEINSLSLPEQTIVHQSSSIPLNEPNSSTNTRNDVEVNVIARSPNKTTVISRPSKTTKNHSLNCARILKIMRSFGVTKPGCSTNTPHGVVARSPSKTTVISRPSKRTNNRSLNYARINQIMGSFGLTEHSCSTILRDIDKAIISSPSPSKETGVINVKIWKIKTEVYKHKTAVERLLMEKCCSDISAISSLRVFGYSSNGSTTEEKECVICMEDYMDGSIGIKLPCNHEFHAPCIFKWLQIKNHCPLCRFPISRGVKYYVDMIHYSWLIK